MIWKENIGLVEYSMSFKQISMDTFIIFAPISLENFSNTSNLFPKNKQ